MGKETVDKLMSRVEILINDSFIGSIRSIVESLPLLAKQLDRSVPKVTILGDDFMIRKDLGPKFEDIFMHMFRNSLLYAFHKDQSGEIRIQLEEYSDSYLVKYQDSGAGIPFDALKEIVTEREAIVALEDREIAQYIFNIETYGVDLKAKGLIRAKGIAAVAAIIKDLEGDIYIEMDEESQGNVKDITFVMRFPKLNSLKPRHLERVS